MNNKVQNIFLKRFSFMLVAAVLVGAFVPSSFQPKSPAFPSAQSESNQSVTQTKVVRGSDLAARKLLVEFIGQRLLTSSSTISMREIIFRNETVEVRASNKYRDCTVTVRKDDNLGNDLGWLVSGVDCESK